MPCPASVKCVCRQGLDRLLVLCRNPSPTPAVPQPTPLEDPPVVNPCPLLFVMNSESLPLMMDSINSTGSGQKKGQGERD